VVVVPPNPQRKQPWALDKQRYRRRNEVERLFRRLNVNGGQETRVFGGEVPFLI